LLLVALGDNLSRRLQQWQLFFAVFIKKDRSIDIASVLKDNATCLNFFTRYFSHKPLQNQINAVTTIMTLEQEVVEEEE
jgi:hypothetical protein